MAEFKFKRHEHEAGLFSVSRIWETADGRVVEDGHPDAAFLIAGAGGRINPKTAERLGITASGVKSRPEGPEVVHSTAAESAKPALVGEVRSPRAEEAAPLEEREPEHSRTLRADTIKRGGRR